YASFRHGRRSTPPGSYLAGLRDGAGLSSKRPKNLARRRHFSPGMRMALVTIRILDGADRGRLYDDVSTPVTIGREEGNDIQLADERVSRFHLKIQEDQEKVVLTDLDSTNGTKVNGDDTQLRILRYGDM